MIDKLLDEYLNSMGESDTDSVYRASVSRIRRWYIEIIKRETVEVGDMTEFKKWLESEGLKDKTVRLYLTVMNNAFRLGVALDLLDAALYQKMKIHLSAMNGGRVVFNRRQINNDDIKSVLAYYKDMPQPNNDEKARAVIARITFLRTRAMVYTIDDTGLRITELLSLNRREFDEFLARWDGLNDMVLPILGKGKKIRDVIFGRKSLAKISDYLNHRGFDNFVPLFISHGNRSKGKRPKRQTINGILSRVTDELDLSTSVSPHSVRHYFGDNLSQAGVPLEDIQDLMGHDDPRTTKQNYIHTRRTSHLAKVKREAFDNDDDI